MKKITLLLLPVLFLFSCNGAEHGSPDNETIARKLFDALRSNDFEKTEILFPDKGTYRKIMAEAKNMELPPEAYDVLIATGNQNFTAVHSMLPDWTAARFANSHESLTKAGGLQLGTVTVKFDMGGDSHKFSFTAAKYNSRWFYLGDMIWIAKSAASVR